DELTRFGGELDAAVQMPGWTNVWTMPIQNRVDMLATGVNTPIGIRVLGRNLDDVVRGSDEVARVVKGLPGAVDVVADPIRGKPYIEVRLDRERAARLGVRAREVNEVIETALAGKVVSATVEGRERHPVVVLIFLILYWTYHDLADAALMMLAVPGAIAGGLFFQWLLGLKLSVTVWVGYIACFGMATSTGIIMLVYLREAVERAGGLDGISVGVLRQAVFDGAVHRLRPKLLTEGTVVIGLAPLLWSSGV